MTKLTPIRLDASLVQLLEVARKQAKLSKSDFIRLAIRDKAFNELGRKHEAVVRYEEANKE